MEQKKILRVAFALAACILVWMGVVARPSRGADPVDDAILRRRTARMLDSLHKGLAAFVEEVGGLSPEEQVKYNDLERGVEIDLKANPQLLDQPAALRQAVLVKFRALLSPVHQKKFDEVVIDFVRRQDELATTEHIKQIGVAIMLYSREHNDALPPDLATLLSKSLGPETFLVGGATTQPSTAPAEQDAQHQAKWVTQNSDFIYLAAGKNFSQLPSPFVVVYVKPAAAGKDGSHFLLDDGSVVKLTPEQSAVIVAELQSGHNPPPSLKKFEPEK